MNLGNRIIPEADAEVIALALKIRDVVRDQPHDKVDAAIAICHALNKTDRVKGSRPAGLMDVLGSLNSAMAQAGMIAGMPAPPKDESKSTGLSQKDLEDLLREDDKK